MQNSLSSFKEYLCYLDFLSYFDSTLNIDITIHSLLNTTNT